MYIITGERKPTSFAGNLHGWWAFANVVAIIIILKGGVAMVTKIPFDKEVGGYNRLQVDSYVALLTEAYSEAYSEYERASSRYSKLLDKIYRGEEIEEVVGKEKTLDDYYHEAIKLDAQVNALRL